MNKYIVFHSTSLVFKSEKVIKDRNIDYKIIPTPKIYDQVYCGVCICIDEGNYNRVKKLLNDNYIEHYTG